VKTKQHKSSNFMKGVSDTIYLAFVGILSVGGTVYIYNDINANKAASPVSVQTTQSSSQATHEAAPAIETKEETAIAVVEVEKNAAVIETQSNTAPEPSAVDVPVVKVEQEEQVKVETAAIVKQEVITEAKPEQQPEATQSTVETVSVEEKSIFA